MTEKRKKRDNRTEIIAVRLTPAERELWESDAAKEFKDLPDYIRTHINGHIIRREVERVNVDLGPILQELKELQEYINKRDDLIEINRAMLVQNAAALNIVDQSLEEKILAHVANRTLFTAQIIEFLGEDPEVVIPLLASMEKRGLIMQNKFRRWKKVMMGEQVTNVTSK